jgi:hypothetical protein
MIQEMNDNCRPDMSGARENSCFEDPFPHRKNNCHTSGKTSAPAKICSACINPKTAALIRASVLNPF